MKNRNPLRSRWHLTLAAALTLAATATRAQEPADDVVPKVVPGSVSVVAPVPAEAKALPSSRQLVENLAEAPPVLPPPAQELPLDLCTALRVAEADNPTIGISRQAIQAALANQLRANGLLLPTLRAGTNYHLHNGVLQTSFGEMRQVESRSLYAGAGAGTLATQTVAFPGVQLFSPLADAFFEPVIARRLLAAEQARSAATSNQVLLDVSGRFLELVSAEAELSAIRETQKEANEVVQLTAAFARAGQGREADSRRTQAEAQLLRAEEERSEEQVAVASARLAGLLNLDPSVRLRTPGQGSGMVQLVEADAALDQLIARAQASRPELAALRAEIARRQAQVKQEQFRPFLPTVSVGYSAGTFGGGTNRVDLVPVNAAFGRFGSRADFDVLAYWTVQNLGAGNHARANGREAEVGEAMAEQIRTLNQVRREVMTAYAGTEAGRRRVDIAHAQLKVAESGFREDLNRIRGGIGLPIEVVNSINRLVTARRNVIASLLEYNLGQFQLFVAIGQTPVSACPADNACAAR